jgi:uncharacterized protein YdcH (DUF465 family)
MSAIVLSDHVFRLLERHQKLDSALALARSRRWPDPFEIARLKKLKLVLKDRLAGLLRRSSHKR